jgi:predicted phosphatase
MQQMLFVHDPHKFQILTALLERLIIDVRSMKPQEIALLSDADLAMG